jgi:hypothetical protein
VVPQEVVARIEDEIAVQEIGLWWQRAEFESSTIYPPLIFAHTPALIICTKVNPQADRLFGHFECLLAESISRKPRYHSVPYLYYSPGTHQIQNFKRFSNASPWDESGLLCNTEQGAAR